MSKCQDLEPLFAPYVDGAAASNDRAAVDAHLDRCPPCRDRLAAELAVHEVLVAHRSDLRGCASRHLRTKCAAHARYGAPPRSTGPSAAGTARTWLPLSLAATLLLAVSGAFFYGLNDGVEALATQLTLDHARCFQFAPERLEHADAAVAAGTWVSSHGWGVRLPPSDVSWQLELLGVRRCLVSGTPGVAHVMYKWRGAPLSVFIVPRVMRRGRDSEIHEIAESLGDEALIWSDADRTYVLVAHGRPADLEGVVGYVKANAR